MLAYVPNKNPVIPNTMIATSFQSLHECWPSLSGQNVTISMIGGKIKARAELLTAPTRDMIPLRFGITAAAATVTKWVH